ncbi:MAG: hypothetical protein ACOYXY_16545 [Thermodesulfobacteriota bacterium]
MDTLKILARVAGTAFLAAGAVTLVARKVLPKPSDVMTGATHFRKGLQEFQSGFRTVFFGTPMPDEEEVRQKKEAARIPIE